MRLVWNPMRWQKFYIQLVEIFIFQRKSQKYQKKHKTNTLKQHRNYIKNDKNKKKA